MKRTPLKRKTPMKRGKQRGWNSTLRPVSSKRKRWLDDYYKEVKRRRENGEGDACFRCGSNGPTDPHHTSGRRTKRTMMEFIFIGSDSNCGCHSWIHANETEALEQGWLTEEFFLSAG